MFIRELIAALASSNVRYCIVGGVAVNLHGVPRMTYDIDIVPALDGANLDALAAVLASLKLSPRVPVALARLADPTYRREMAERRLLALTFTDSNDPLREVDVLVSPPGIDADEIVSRAAELRLGDLPVRVVALADLIAMKRLAGRAQDLSDVEHLERIRSDMEGPHDG